MSFPTRSQQVGLLLLLTALVVLVLTFFVHKEKPEWYLPCDKTADYGALWQPAVSITGWPSPEF